MLDSLRAQFAAPRAASADAMPLMLIFAESAARAPPAHISPPISAFRRRFTPFFAAAVSAARHFFISLIRHFRRCHFAFDGFSFALFHFHAFASSFLR